MSFSGRGPLFPYGTAYRRAYAVFASGLFKKCRETLTRSKGADLHSFGESPGDLEDERAIHVLQKH